MKPPVCAVCDLSLSPQNGACLRFKNYTPVPGRIPGHPEGTEWFCEKHLKAAKELTDMDLESALSVLRSFLKN